MFTATLFTIARVWKQTKCLIDQHIKEDVVFIYNGIYSAIKKEEIMPIAATLKLSCEIKKRKINIMHDVIYMWNFSTKQKQTYKDRLVVVKEGAGGGGKIDWKFETSTCKLLDIHVTRLLCCISESNTAILQ